LPHPAQYGIVRVALRPDCPRRDSEKTTVTDRFRNFLFYIAFFPQLVADPIVRAKEFLYQTDRKRSLSC
jgi:D-alanyl-lipoteichoic acid acyltransferase DltB (MBOAT superfamily)